MKPPEFSMPPLISAEAAFRFLLEGAANDLRKSGVPESDVQKLCQAAFLEWLSHQKSSDGAETKE